MTDCTKVVTVTWRRECWSDGREDRRQAAIPESPDPSKPENRTSHEDRHLTSHKIPKASPDIKRPRSSPVRLVRGAPSESRHEIATRAGRGKEKARLLPLLVNFCAVRY